MEGTTLGPYRIIAPLGAGGMGEVFRAYDSRLEREVALKLLPPARAEDHEARARLLREARAAAALNHPHICTIFEVGEAEGQAFIAMELIEGQSLDRVIPAGVGVDEDELFDYGVQMSEAVAHAHDKGVLHRDLKTSNIMLTSARRVKVLDFGLAKRVAGDRPPDLTTVPATLAGEPGRVTGTLAYMSPEQLRGQPATAASDVWALGVVLHEMAAGKRPFDGTTSFEVASAILEQRPHALPTTVHALLRGIVSRCLAKDPSHRYQTAGELRSALEAVRAGVAPPQPPSLGDSGNLPEWMMPGQDLLSALSHRQRIAVVLALPLAAFMAIALLFWLGLVMWPPASGTTSRIASVAVMPLENLSGDPNQDFLAAGVQDGLIAELARLGTFQRVIERRSAARLAERKPTIREIAAALQVESVLTGSVMKVGDRLQLSARLIDAASERHLWADRFDRDQRDILSIQSDVARAVAGVLGADSSPATRDRHDPPVVDPATYEAYLRGMHLVSRGGTTRQERLQGLAILQQAIDRDPGNAQAYAGLALGYVTLGHGAAAEADAWPRARAAAQHAVRLDPNLAEAHAALAEVKTYYEMDWAGAEQAFRRANELNPNLAMNHYHYAWFLVLFSRWDEAIAEHKRAQELDPLTPPHTAHLGTLYQWLGGREDEALAEATKATEFAPNAPAPWAVLARGLANKGQFAEAEAAYQKSIAIMRDYASYQLGVLYAEQGKRAQALEIAAELEAQPPRPWHVWSLSQLYVALGDYERAFKWLHHRPAHAFLPWIRVNPAYEPIHKDPRFAALLHEMRLPMP